MWKWRLDFIVKVLRKLGFSLNNWSLNLDEIDFSRFKPTGKNKFKIKILVEIIY